MRLNKAARWALKQASIGGYKPEHNRLWAQSKAVVRTQLHVMLGTHDKLTTDKATGILYHAIPYRIVKSSPSGFSHQHTKKNATAKAFDKARNTPKI